MFNNAHLLSGVHFCRHMLLQQRFIKAVSDDGDKEQPFF